MQRGGGANTKLKMLTNDRVIMCERDFRYLVTIESMPHNLLLLRLLMVFLTSAYCYIYTDIVDEIFVGVICIILLNFSIFIKAGFLEQFKRILWVCFCFPCPLRFTNFHYI